MRIRTLEFEEVSLVDFEFQCPDGENPRPICLVAKELVSGRTLCLWEDELRRRTAPPYRTDKGVLFIAFYSSAEIGCHLALGWPPPERILDLFTEFRNHTNGRTTPCGSGLLGALTYFGLDGIESIEKESMRELAMRGGPWTPEERQQLLEYCRSDVESLARLLRAMLPHLDMPRALLRGRYMTAAARIERCGVPIDTTTFHAVRDNFDNIREGLIKRVDRDYGVFDGTTFKTDRWERWLSERGYAWPRLESGRLALDDDTFRQMARVYPDVAPIRELRFTLSQTRLSDLAVGSDGRNRTLLSAFRSRTGRNQPSNTKFIFGPSVWLRSLIRPEPAHGLAYVDWSQQEFGIAAALSGDANMIEAYESGDCYLAFAKQAGAAPPDATKASHGAVREQFKQCVLGVQYAMGAESLAMRIGQSPARARELLEFHRQTYPTFWHWSDAAVDHALLHGRLWTVFGWSIHASGNSNVRTFRNFPMQANGAEMLRLACCLATEGGVRVCAPVHDAVLIEAPIGELTDTIGVVQRMMTEASRAVLSGFELRSDVEVFRYPHRYEDKRGKKMWETVMTILEVDDYAAAG